ncbi:MAG TPA: DUF1697 domain-containing protein [Polyangiaceae bacterium]|jgi:uncharacterized protein (DUF1697 family)|nr:DUF1697 domain-containing protein [Polyangiaceae bacterium]
MGVTGYAALLRAVNVGGTGRLAMADLRALCEELGFGSVATYIQSGNVVFSSKLAEAAVVRALQAPLAKLVGKPVGVVVRTGKELEAVLKANPFSKADPKRVLVLFLAKAPSKSVLDGVLTPGGEELALVKREVFIHYPQGMGVSKLKLALQKEGTARNLNTIAKLAEMIAAFG